MGKKKKLNIKIVFDTNVLYNGSCSNLINEKVRRLIKDHSSLEDIEVFWFLPQIVIYEREYQMRKKGGELLPSITKKILQRKYHANFQIN